MRKKIAQYIIEKRLVSAGVAPKYKEKSQPDVLEGEFRKRRFSRRLLTAQLVFHYMPIMLHG